MARLLRGIVVAAVIAAALLGMIGAAAVAYSSMGAITVTNLTQQAVPTKVGLTGKLLWEGRLRPQGSKWVFGIPGQDGSVEVSLEIGGTILKVECGYVTPGLGGPYRLSIQPDCRTECEHKYG